MALAYRLYVGVVTALILCHYSLAEWNATEDEQGNSTVALHHQGNSNNFTEDLNETQTDGESGGRIIKCPLEFQHYCIHGSCQFYEALDSPSCSCNPGYTGYRCELFDLGWQVTDQRQIIVACVITALVFMILLIVFICICAHRHKISFLSFDRNYRYLCSMISNRDYSLYSPAGRDDGFGWE
ncbi:hypothetical protein DPEC_G00335280 [Dallia pectoralis]|uniref:Uncharacterized protein n=1 Tax=Dallia pectoralis TaxID=75939 RepID=A0ACC2F6X6_DALPE|nr:hypothetical protein DPEC_G00335280 [Dallia pectoralis]